MASRGLPLGRYTLFDVIASGGMASVHFGRMMGPAGFARTVAIKRLHPHLAGDTEFATMFLDEARLAARIQHPNVVQTLDVVSFENELLLVMEYVRGETLSRLERMSRKRGAPIPQRVLSAIVLGALYGLHAAHEAKTEHGEPLAIVHRDVSPQNILVGADGIARVVDFGVAKAASRAHSTRDGKVKGKLAYMSPEQLKRQDVDRRADVYAVGVMLWECLAGKRLFVADDAVAVMHAVLYEPVPPIGSVVPDVSPELAAVVHRALDRDPAMRFQTTIEMAEALEAAMPPAQQREVGTWVKETAGESLGALEAKLGDIESSTPSQAIVPPPEITLSEAQTSVMLPLDGSVMTGVSVVHDTPIHARARWRAAAVLIAAVLASVVAFVILRTREPVVVSTLPVTSTNAIVATVVPSAPASSTIASVIPPAATTTSKPIASATSAHVRTNLPTTTPKTTKNCSPPVYVDSAGIEHIKPECL